MDGSSHPSYPSALGVTGDPISILARRDRSASAPLPLSAC